MKTIAYLLVLLAGAHRMHLVLKLLSHHGLDQQGSQAGLAHGPEFVNPCITQFQITQI